MPAAVEVIAAGIRLVYPTSYVLVTDYDSMHNDSANLSEFSVGVNHTKKSMHTCEMLDDVALMGSDVYHVEPSPFTTSNHPLLGNNAYSLYSSSLTMNSYKSLLLNTSYKFML
jgi:hypothetical protein